VHPQRQLRLQEGGLARPGGRQRRPAEHL
jgi:hypothetical protein